MIICAAMMYIRCLYFLDYITAQMDETRSGVFFKNSFNLRPKYKSIHVKISSDVEHGKKSPDYQSMMQIVNRHERNH